jgi:hypothetical protein
MREARSPPPAHQGARVIRTDALRFVLILREPRDGQERKQDSEDDPDINAHQLRISARYANRRTRGAFRSISPHCGTRSGLGVMAEKSAFSYRVSRNGLAGDWYWEVISDRKIIDRGLAPTRAQARALAIKVMAFYAVRQPEDSTPPFEGLKAIEEP